MWKSTIPELKPKKIIFKVSFKTMRTEIEPDRNSDLQHEAVAKRNISAPQQ